MTAQETVNSLQKCSGTLAGITSGDITNAAYEIGDREIERYLETLTELIVTLKDDLDNYQAEQEEENQP